jgi:hypothetical protein
LSNPPGENPFGDHPPQSGAPNPYQPSQYAPNPTAAGDIDPALKYVVPIGASLWAILAGYAGLLSLGFCCLGPFAIVFGILGIRDIRRNPQKHGMARCILGIVFGLIGSIGFVVLLFVISTEKIK